MTTLKIKKQKVLKKCNKKEILKIIKDFED